jgi:glycosyltransferase involved in cell wall biosynthesis
VNGGSELGKILIVIADLPYPNHKSGMATTLFNLSEQWIKTNDIDFFYYDERDLEAEHYYEKCGMKISYQNLVSRNNKYIEKLSNRTLIKPRNSIKYHFSSKTISFNDGYDLIILVGFTSVFLFDHLNKMNKSKVIFFELDCLSLLYIRYYQNSSSLLKKLYYYSQYLVTRSIEEYYYSRVNKILFVSEVDKNHCAHSFHKIDDIKFDNIVNGVEMYVKRSNNNNTDSKKINIGFSGILNYTPNAKAVEFIVDHIMAKAIEMDDSIVFHIIGKNPPGHLEKYKEKFGEHLVITGFVEDINEYLSNLDIFISPLFVGTGMKNKILQAMNLGIPIICTSVSVEGISELKDQENYLICDSVNGDEWANKIHLLVHDAERRGQFSTETVRIIKDNYSWGKIAEDFIRISMS